MIRAVQIKRVLVRHVLELVRDRRTLVTLLMVPVLTVLIMTLSREEIAGQISAEARITHTIAVENLGDGGDLTDSLGMFANLDLLETEDAFKAVRDGEAQLGLILPSNFARLIERGEQAEVTIVQGESTIRASLAEATLQGALNGWVRRVVNERLEAAGLPPETARPITIDQRNVSTPEERSGSILAQFLPLLMIASVLSLMIAVTVDMTAGEKERRTLEALLVTPLHRREVVFGKWLVAVLIGSTGAAITIGVALLTLRFGSNDLLGDVRLLPSGAIVSLMVGGISAAIVLASIQLTIGFLARSTQQAGAMSSPLFFIAFVPLLLFTDSSGTAIGLHMYAIPALGPMLLARFGLAGSTVAGALPMAVISSIAYGTIILLLADRLFRSERALQRT